LRHAIAGLYETFLFVISTPEVCDSPQWVASQKQHMQRLVIEKARKDGWSGQAISALVEEFDGAESPPWIQHAFSGVQGRLNMRQNHPQVRESAPQRDTTTAPTNQGPRRNRNRNRRANAEARPQAGATPSREDF
ncbi:MAG: hypothetical protein GY700_01975, partial [Propionibacteriaceae bacterium]|nr:hypothetical protein [Propionibacteriaceae bacterium]